MNNTNSKQVAATADELEVAAASVLGRDHRRLDRPCQDAFAVRRVGVTTVAVVCDGCGSGAHSELGARLGANLFATALVSALGSGDVADPAPWEAACLAVLAQLAELAPILAGDLATAVSEHLLFTLLAVAVTPAGAAVLAIGDGVVIVDGAARVLDAGPDNAPPYLAYELLGRAIAREVIALPPGVQTIVLASDGAIPLLAHGGRALPGASDRGRCLDLLDLDDRLFGNRDLLRRRLALASQDVVDVDWATGRMVRHAGLLADDTTVVALRRRA